LGAVQYTNLPRPLPVSLYERAVDTYVRRVRARALAIYRVGAFRVPGLSDVDLLVVPRTARFDNGLYFAIHHVLPESLRAPFRSDPSILPEGLLEALRYTTHENRRLLHGEDLAAEIACDDAPEQRWSMLFERLCQFDRVGREAEAAGSVDLAGLIAKTKSIGYSLVDVDRLTGSTRAPSFVADVDALRAGFFEIPAQHAGPRVHALFRRGLEATVSSLEKHLPLEPGQAVVDFGRAFLFGEAKIPGLDESALHARRVMVERVQRMTRAYGCKKGDVFMRTPYRERIAALNRQHRPSLPLRVAAELAYRLRARMRREPKSGS
jgi:hypothetical protein